MSSHLADRGQRPGSKRAEGARKGVARGGGTHPEGMKSEGSEVRGSWV